MKIQRVNSSSYLIRLVTGKSLDVSVDEKRGALETVQARVDRCEPIHVHSFVQRSSLSSQELQSQIVMEADSGVE